MVTHSGVYVDPENYHSFEIKMEDIAWHLSYINRFNGGALRAVSVAEHCVNCVLFEPDVTDTLKRSLLLHDAAEAYIGDVVMTQKNKLPAVKRWEALILERVARQFGCDFSTPIIRAVDDLIFAAESRLYHPKCWKYVQARYAGKAVPKRLPFQAYSAEEARDRFLTIYEEICE